MFEWKKLGKIFDPTEVRNIWWMKEFAQAPSVLIFEKFVRVFFSCRPAADSNGQYVSYLGYADLKRDNLFEVINICKKPVLELGSLGTFDEFGVNPASVIRHGQEVRVYYAGWTRCESVTVNAAVGVAISYDDGVNFSRLGNGPVLSYSIDEPFVLGSPRIRKFNDKWYLWYVAGKRWVENKNGNPEPIYKIRMATSFDGIKWVKHGSDLIESKLGDSECQASPDVFFRNGKYHMFFSYRFNFDFKTKDKGYRIGYAHSKDLITWVRDDDKAGIRLSDAGWDSEMISYPHLFELDSHVFMLYQGNHIGKYGFGLAELKGEL
ncbi:hypothetical protein [Alkalimarinus coralli]|uniref:hypothetical protein n=1 Tax=Alkalimarinus coralli TaxID=2935863 RepID=UPI00202B0B19|nr:hypothetical protein [Alkalimarinus coralli]